MGTYPQANGQVYGGGESSTNEADMMPVEESANMILLCAAIAKMEGNAEFSATWWPQLTRWEAYLEKYGEDPENQLCTDDFMGHLAHNANLSVKAILAIAAYGELCRMRGDQAAATKYKSLAKEYAQHWMKVAADGDHYRIAFDKPNTWSQKYNLVWDKLLGLDIFPAEVAKKGSRFLQDPASAIRRAARFAHPPYQDGLVSLERDPGRKPGRLRGNRLADPRLSEPDDRPAAVCRLVHDRQRSERRHACQAGDRRRVHQDARGSCHLEEVVEPRPGASRQLGAGPVAASQSPKSCRRPSTSPPSGATRSPNPAPTGPGPSFDDSDVETRPRRVRHDRNTRCGHRHDLGHAGHLAAPRGDPARRDRSRQIQLRVYHDEDVEVYIDGVLAASQSGYVTAYDQVEIRPTARASC